jgi:hypothetical protein
LDRAELPYVIEDLLGENVFWNEAVSLRMWHKLSSSEFNAIANVEEETHSDVQIVVD